MALFLWQTLEKTEIIFLMCCSVQEQLYLDSKKCIRDCLSSASQAMCSKQHSEVMVSWINYSFVNFSFKFWMKFEIQDLKYRTQCPLNCWRWPTRSVLCSSWIAQHGPLNSVAHFHCCPCCVSNRMMPLHFKQNNAFQLEVHMPLPSSSIFTFTKFDAIIFYATNFESSHYFRDENVRRGWFNPLLIFFF